MQIYNNHIAAGEYENFIWRSGSMYLLRLTGINIVYGRKIDVLPVYSPALIVESRKGSLRVEFSIRDHLFRIVFLRRKPFVYTEFYNKTNKEFNNG